MRRILSVRRVHTGVTTVTCPKKAALQECVQKSNWKSAIEVLRSMEAPELEDFQRAISCCEASLKQKEADRLFAQAVKLGISMPTASAIQLHTADAAQAEISVEAAALTAGSDVEPPAAKEKVGVARRRTIDLTHSSLALGRVALRHALNAIRKQHLEHLNAAGSQSSLSRLEAPSVSLAAAAAAIPHHDALSTPESLEQLKDMIMQAAQKQSRRRPQARLAGVGSGGEFRVVDADSVERSTPLPPAPGMRPDTLPRSPSVSAGLAFFARGAPMWSPIELDASTFYQAQNRSKALFTAATRLSQAASSPRLCDLYITTPRGNRSSPNNGQLTLRNIFRLIEGRPNASFQRSPRRGSSAAALSDVAAVLDQQPASGNAEEGLSTAALRARVCDFLRTEMGISSSLHGKHQIKISAQQLADWCASRAKGTRTSKPSSSSSSSSSS